MDVNRIIWVRFRSIHRFGHWMDVWFSGYQIFRIFRFGYLVFPGYWV